MCNSPKIQQMLLWIFSALLHTYVAWRLLPPLQYVSSSLQMVIAAVIVLSALMVPLGIVGRRFSRKGVAHALTWMGLIFMGWLSSLFVLTLARDVLSLLIGLGQLGFPGHWEMESLRTFDVWSAIVVWVLGSVITLMGFVNARRTAQVVTVDVPIAELPEALHGFTIAQISDIHVGPTIKKPYLTAIVDAVNRLGADMVAITGDLVDGSVHELAEHVAPLRNLVSRHGSYFVTGNHEYYSGASHWIVELRRLGVKVLLNEHVVLSHDEARLVVAGVTDYSAHHFDPAQRSDPGLAIAHAPASVLRILLAHQPRSAIAAANAGYHLQLSGHTHGGQFLPWSYFVKFQQPFTAGLHRLHNLWVYTSRGTGYWGPPKRFGAPSEITCLRLVQA